MSRASGPAPPDVTVVIPARNAARTIGETLASLATEADLIRDVIIVDDGSTDATATVAGESATMHGLPFRLLGISAEDAGAARNAGIAAARDGQDGPGGYLYFVDADDLHVEGGLRALREGLRASPHAGAAIGGFIRDVDGRKARRKRISGIGRTRRRNVERLLADRLGSIAMGSVLLRHDAIGDKRFPVDLPFDEDTLFWAQILNDTDAIVVPKSVLIYRVSSQRSDRRFVEHSRAVFLRWLREARRLEKCGVGRHAIAQRAAIIAFKIARTHYTGGDIARSWQFIGAAGKLWRTPAGAMRVWRYRRRILARFVKLPTNAAALARIAPVFAVVISADPFSSPVSGVDLRNWQNARALANSGRVVIASLHGAPDSGPRTPHPAIVATALAHSGEKRGASLGERRTYIDPRISRLARERIQTLVRLARPSVVVVEGIHLWPLIDAVRQLVPTLVLDMHNVESELATTMNAGGRRSKSLQGDAALLREREKAAAVAVDRIWVCSDVDRNRLRSFCPEARAVHVVPNGVPRPERLATQHRSAPDGNRPLDLLFVGHLGYPPNVAAATRLIERILPDLRAAGSDVRLVVAGRSPNADIHVLAASHTVTLVENPNDLARLYAEADIAVIPLSEGGGTRIKILEAMAHGVPVVATAIAAEGLPFRDGTEIFVAQTDSEFVERIRRLASRADCYEMMRRSALDSVMAQFGPTQIADAVRNALGPAATAKGARADPENAGSENAGAQGGSRRVTLRNRGLTYSLVTSGASDDYHLWAADTGAWTDLHDCLLSLIRPGDTVIDAGANIGTVTIPLAAAGARVIAYECAVENTRLLDAAVAANRFQDRVTVRERALWDRPGTLSFAGGSAWGHISNDGSQRVLATTLDDDLPAGEIVQVVKMDVEGAELHVLRGMQRLIKAQHPDIVFECNAEALGRIGSSIVDVFALLRRHGYRIYRIHEPRRLLRQTSNLQIDPVRDYLATTRPPLIQMIRTGQRIGTMRPRHMIREVLNLNWDSWVARIQLAAIGDHLPTIVRRHPGVAERLDHAQRYAADHELLEAFRLGNFGAPGAGKRHAPGEEH